MSRILVIQHVAHEGLGTIAPFLNEFDIDFLKVYEAGKINAAPEGYSALVVMGGPMGVYEEDKYPFIKDELRLIEAALKEGVPVLGICLGAQLLARAAGAEVYKGKAKEIGWYKVRLSEEGLQDRLLLGLPEEFTVFQWHGDTFDIPKNGVCLASSDLFLNQIIKVGKNAYGFQFHLEVTEKMIAEWIEINTDELKALKEIDATKIIKETPENIQSLRMLGNSVFGKFRRLID
ncbi:MAG: gamma-glutamyl-gamma-aminobutyrate hydrolase family protein [Deltaproteobacteria bacterium]|nr:gamma-glutamyl-gamma-aminobutyrate hydrolase family protein [Deltaproteobacteria bacterium]